MCATQPPPRPLPCRRAQNVRPPSTALLSRLLPCYQLVIIQPLEQQPALGLERVRYVSLTGAGRPAAGEGREGVELAAPGPERERQRPCAPGWRVMLRALSLRAREALAVRQQGSACSWELVDAARQPVCRSLACAAVAPPSPPPTAVAARLSS